MLRHVAAQENLLRHVAEAAKKAKQRRAKKIKCASAISPCLLHRASDLPGSERLRFGSLGHKGCGLVFKTSLLFRGLGKKEAGLLALRAGARCQATRVEWRRTDMLLPVPPSWLAESSFAMFLLLGPIWIRY